jgi:hypothetical protein
MTSRPSPRILHHPPGPVIQAFLQYLDFIGSKRSNVLHAILVLNIGFIRRCATYFPR